MTASPNDYMDIIFPCLTTYLMQVPKMFFIVQQKKAEKHSAEKHKAKIIQQKTAKKHTAKKHRAEKHLPEKLIFWITYLDRFV